MMFLVEEHEAIYGHDEKIAFHIVIDNTIGPMNAFKAASERRPKGPLLYAADELVEQVTDFLWVAGDGSDNWVEVRKIR